MLDWWTQRVTNAFNSAVEKGIYILLVAVVFAAWKWGSGDVTLPFWLLVLFIGGPLVAAVVARRRGRAPVAEAASTIEQLEHEIALYGYYASHLSDVLRTVQQKLRGDLDEITTDAFVEQGVLQPAREFLQQAPGEDVRLSVLVPHADGNFRMRWMAGHRLASKAAFRLTVTGSFSQIALQSGQFAWSYDVGNDHRFTRHPKAESGREYASLVSVPIRGGEDVVAVLNVVSTAPYAFTLPDFVFISLLAAVLEVIWAIADAPDEAEQPQLEAGG